MTCIHYPSLTFDLYPVVSAEAGLWLLYVVGGDPDDEGAVALQDSRHIVLSCRTWMR